MLTLIIYLLGAHLQWHLASKYRDEIEFPQDAVVIVFVALVWPASSAYYAVMNIAAWIKKL